MSIPSAHQFGSALRRRRLRTGLSLREFAARITYSPGHLSHVETGVKLPTVKFAEACERELGLSGQLLVFLSTNPNVLPAQLPASGGLFLGRTDQLCRMVASLREGTRILLIDGPPGIGKTAMAIRCASEPEVAARYPDGVLFADLQGFSSSRSPIKPTDVGKDFLLALGVGQEQVPANENARFALLRSVLARRRVLIVLDNAATGNQVRPLLPGSGRCAVIVTSRRRLSGLTIRDGAVRSTLGPLAEDDAIKLLTRIIGTRAEDDPLRTATLARLCAQWPLALRIVGELVVAHKHVDLAELCDELGKSRLEALSPDEDDDETAAVRAAFDLSYQALPPADMATFRLLGLPLGRDIGLSAVAVLSGQPEPDAHAQLRRLCQAHLVTERQRGRYHLHDLLRLYAAERGTREDSSAERAAAVKRLLDYYQGTIFNCAERLAPFRSRPEVDLSALSVTPMRPNSYEEALAWCDVEAPNFPDVVRLANLFRYPRVWRFAACLWDYFHVRRPWDCWWSTTVEAQLSFDYEPDAQGQAWLLTSLGDHLRRRADAAGARPLFEEALKLLSELGDCTGQSWLLLSLGVVNSIEGKPAEAIESLSRSLTIFTELEDFYGQGRCLQLIGYVLHDAGDREGALANLRDALRLFGEIGDAHDKALVLSALGRIHSDPRTTIRYLDAALPTLRTFGDWKGEADALIALGDANWHLSEETTSRMHWQQALEILRCHGETAQVAALVARITETSNTGPGQYHTNLGTLYDC